MKSYLTFTLKDCEYGINIENTLNIEEVTKTSKSPNLPVYVKGVIKKHNTTIPVIDLKMKLGIEETKTDIFTSLIIVNINYKNQRLQAALLTDGVQSVLEFQEEELIPYSDKKLTGKCPYYKGKIKYQGELIKVLDINAIFTSIELQKIKKAIHQEEKAEIEI